MEMEEQNSILERLVENLDHWNQKIVEQVAMIIFLLIQETMSSFGANELLLYLGQLGIKKKLTTCINLAQSNSDLKKLDLERLEDYLSKIE